jgi:hypothetical protein
MVFLLNSNKYLLTNPVMKFSYFMRIFTFIALIVLIGYSPRIMSGILKKVASRTFGIDATEDHLNTPFVPSIKGLNTMTMHPCSDEPEQMLSVAEVAYHIHADTLPEIAHLSIKTTEPRAYTCWQLEPGIRARGKTTFVVVRGYAGAAEPAKPGSPENKGMCAVPRNGGGVVTAYQWFKHGVIHDTAIAWDYPDTRFSFDFGGENDRMCLDYLHEQLCDAGTQPVFLANCRGSKSVLNFLAKSRPHNVAAVVLDAPFMDLENFTDAIGKSYGRFIPFSNRIAYNVITGWHSSYNPANDIAMADLRNIPQEIPIFIAHLKNDCLVADDMIRAMVKELADSGHTVYLLVIDDPTKSHSRLYQTEPFKLAVNAFFKRYNIPHNEELAHKGRFLLNYAAYNVKRPDNWYIYHVR